MISQYGADTARWFMLSDSPPERDLQWTETGITSSYKFINKLWSFVSMYNSYENENAEDQATVNEFKILINSVSENIERFQFNKSVANIYEYVNILSDAVVKKTITKKDFQWSLKKLSIILQPFLPHISEEIWSSFENSELCINQEWPVEKSIDIKRKISIAVQINGKTRSVIEIEKNYEKEEVLKIAKGEKKISKYLVNKKILKEIYVPERIINFVI